jgi:hypothetical protein
MCKLIDDQCFRDFQIVEKLWKNLGVFPQSIYTQEELPHEDSLP